MMSKSRVPLRTNENFVSSVELQAYNTKRWVSVVFSHFVSRLEDQFSPRAHRSMIAATFSHVAKMRFPTL